MKQLLPILFFCFSFISLNSLGQVIKYYQPFDTISSKSNFYLVGNMHDKQLVLKLFAEDLPKLLIFNDSGYLEAQHVISIPQLKNTVIPKILIDENNWTIVMQYQEANNIYVATATLSENGTLLEPYTRIDSSRIDKLGDGAYYHFLISTDKKKTILYRMMLGLQTDKLLMDYLAVTPQGKITERGSHYISYNKNSENITPLFQHSSGETFFAIYNKPENLKSSSKTRIYQLTTSISELLVKEVDFKVTKLIHPVFVSNSMEHELSFVSLYNEQGSTSIKGLVITKINLDRKMGNPSVNIHPFKKTRKGEFYLGDRRIKLGLNEMRDDVININSCSFLGPDKKLTIVFENRYSYMSSKMKSENFDPRSQGTIAVMGQSNLAPSQEFDLLRNYASTVNTSNYLSPGSGSFYTLGLKTAPVSTQYILGGPFSEILSDRYTYGFQPLPNSVEHNVIQHDRTQLQFDNNHNPIRKDKLTIKYSSPQIQVESGNIVSADELVILNYSLTNNVNISMQLFDTVNPAYQALLHNINGYKPFYGDSFSYAGNKKIYTLFTTSDNKNIGIALISW